MTFVGAGIAHAPSRTGSVCLHGSSSQCCREWAVPCPTAAEATSQTTQLVLHAADYKALSSVGLTSGICPAWVGGQSPVAKRAIGMNRPEDCFTGDDTRKMIPGDLEFLLQKCYISWQYHRYVEIISTNSS
jgi:hypothetical protein